MTRDTRRFLTQRDRQRVYARADGLCEVCNNELPPSWHAHHIKHWSNGGVTCWTNIQALCPQCHKKLHDEEDATT